MGEAKSLRSPTPRTRFALRAGLIAVFAISISPRVAADPPVPVDPALPRLKVVVGLPPYLGKALTDNKATPQSEHFAEHAHIDWSISMAHSRLDFLSRIARFEYEYVLPPTDMVHYLVDQLGFQPVVRSETEASLVLVVTQRSGRRRAEDLGGTSVAVSELLSPSVEASRLFESAGLDSSHEVRLLKRAGDDTVLLEVLDGAIPAGVVARAAMDALAPRLRESLVVLHEVAHGATMVLLASPRVAADRVERVRRAYIEYSHSPHWEDDPWADAVQSYLPASKRDVERFAHFDSVVERYLEEHPELRKALMAPRKAAIPR